MQMKTLRRDLDKTIAEYNELRRRKKAERQNQKQGHKKGFR